ncbi:MAG: hypothetical protein KJT03_16760 [Verrucomicrobiae bacterium]|nr:hypothetical protein [Verrucomicrobiae bacterium]
MGDYNLPKIDEKNNVYRALLENDFILPQHSTAMGSSLSGENHYDQVLFHSGGMQDAYTGASGVFDFDHEPFFKSAWNKGKEYFNATVKYHIADHRPMWAAFKV